MEKVIKYQATEADEGWLVRSVMKTRLRLSATQIKRAKFKALGITVNGRQVTVRARLQAGDMLQVRIEDAQTQSAQLVPRPGPLQIAYEDSELMVVNKPAGLPVHPSPGHYDDTLANILVWHFQQRGQGLVVRTLGRLDKDTSGLILVAKNAPAQTELERQRAEGALQRIYLALVEGQPVPPSGRVDAPIGCRSGSLMAREVRDDGMPAVTDYETLAAGEAFSLVRLRLHTGRTHQIRVHMAHLGHPLLGDFLYGQEGLLGMARTALHSSELAFRHPVSGEALRFQSPLPPDMDRLARMLEGGQAGAERK